MQTEKPEDYLVYFNEDGTSRANPYASEELGATNIPNAYAWSKRQTDIKRSQMSEQERVKYDETVENFKKRMRS